MYFYGTLKCFFKCTISLLLKVMYLKTLSEVHIMWLLKCCTGTMELRLMFTQWGPTILGRYVICLSSGVNKYGLKNLDKLLIKYKYIYVF